MRKSKLIPIVLVLVSTLAGCGGGMPNSPDPSVETIVETETAQGNDLKIAEPILYCSAFSEGVAVAYCQTESYDSKTHRGGAFYGINTDGEILFELSDINPNETIGTLSSYRFINGLMEINGGLCDKAGKMTYPADLGAETFYCFALGEGYILADVVIADFQGTKSKLGILNTKFEWVVEPNEELYQVFEEYKYKSNYVCVNDTCIYYYSGKVLELKTGKMKELSEVQGEFPAQTWIPFSDNTYINPKNDVMLDLSEYENISIMGRFVNSTAVLSFYNSDAKKHYLTVIDDEGVFLFEPIELSMDSCSIDFDGNTVLVYERLSIFGGIGQVQTYDLNGKLIAEMNAEDINEKCIGASIGDGVVMLMAGLEGGTWLLSTELAPLF